MTRRSGLRSRIAATIVGLVLLAVVVLAVAVHLLVARDRVDEARAEAETRIAAAADPAQAERDFIARQPMGRLAHVDDLAPMVVYLLSDESRFMSGQAVLVDGGVTI